MRESWRAQRGTLARPTPAANPAWPDKLHRAWIDLKHRLGGGDASVLVSVESGEHNARNHYREALRAGLPRDVQDIVERQAESVFAAHDQVRTLQHMYQSAA